MIAPSVAMLRPDLHGPWFGADSWSNWRTFADGLCAAPMTEDQLAVWTKYTGRTEAPKVPFREAGVIVGRRGGKSQTMACLGVNAAFKDYSAVLSPGEKGIVMLLASDRRQAQVLLGYVKSLILDVPTLAAMVDRVTAEAIHLSNGIVIEVHTASFKAVRGYTIVFVVCDEIATWPSDEASANLDSETLAALRPAMATVPTSQLILISSPYARRGVLWEMYREHWGKNDSPVLIWRAPSLSMNPSLDPRVVADAYKADPIAAAAEYGAEFRSDVAAFVSREIVEGCTFPDRHELRPLSEYRYQAFVDPSGGSADSMTLAIAHRDGDTVVLDAIRECIPPLSPDGVVKEFAALLKSYGIHRVVGDRYAGEWPRERFAAAGITYDPAAKPKRELYQSLLPVLNAGRVELLDIPKLAAQLVGLERRTARGGRDSIDHAPRAHDDVANALAGVVAEVLSGRAKGDFGISFGYEISEPFGVMSERNPADAPELQRQRDRELIARHGH